MESLGKYLKTERERRNLSLEEAAKSTKIRIQFLGAIEEDKYELLPPGVYVKGFLTLYAKYLGLDPQDIGLRYQNYLKNLTISQPLELEQQIPPPKKRTEPWLFWVAISTIIFFIVLFVYYSFRDHSERFRPSFKEESTSVPLPSIPSPLPNQGKAETQITHQAVQEEIPKLKEAETKDALRPESLPFEVLEASIGTRIEREGSRLVLRGKCSQFTCNNQRAYFFTRIRTRREGKIAHVWFWDGKEFNRIEIEVKAPVWSVYSYITLRPQHAGNWKAEARDGDNVLNSLGFKATEADSYSIQEKN
jgi:transcriptional regulator with XRE-family HTH domain